MNQAAIEQLINLNKIKTRDIKSRRELWKDKIYFLEHNPYWDKNTHYNLPMPSTFHRVQQELKKTVQKQEKELKNPNCHILEHTSEHLVFVFFPEPPVFENLKEFLWTTGNNVWYETEKWERTRLHVKIYAKKEKILAGYMRWLCSAWQGVVHNSPLLTTAAPLLPWNMTNYDEVCMCPSVLNATKTVEFTVDVNIEYSFRPETLLIRGDIKRHPERFQRTDVPEWDTSIIDKNKIECLDWETDKEMITIPHYNKFKMEGNWKDWERDWRFFLIAGEPGKIRGKLDDPNSNDFEPKPHDQLLNYEKWKIVTEKPKAK